VCDGPDDPTPVVSAVNPSESDTMAYVAVAGKHSRVVVIVVFDGVTLLVVAVAGEV
jgi:hypothetical protein